MEAAVEAANWETALCAVERNRGAPGPDGMKVGELREHLAKHGAGIKAKLPKGSFKPSSESEATEVLQSISQWISRKLKLQINTDKSGAGRVWERKFDSAALRPSGSSFLAVCLTSFGSRLHPHCWPAHHRVTTSHREVQRPGEKQMGRTAKPEQRATA